LLDILEDVIQIMKSVAKDKLVEFDELVEQIENEINQTELPADTKAQLIEEIKFDAETKKNQLVSVFADVIMPLETTLEREKYAQGLIEELTDDSISDVRGGGCLIATATFGSELAPQVQMLREIRDNSLLQTQSGQSFMQGFNQFYYSFSPTIADYERQNPIFKEAVKLTITPLLASLSLLNYVDMDSEESVLGYGIGIILINVGMYFVAPALLVISFFRKR